MYRRMNYNTILHNNLTIVDQQSVIIARDNHMPFHVFDFDEKQTITRICAGDENIGTIVDMVDDVMI